MSSTRIRDLRLVLLLLLLAGVAALTPAPVSAAGGNPVSIEDTCRATAFKYTQVFPNPPSGGAVSGKLICGGSCDTGDCKKRSINHPTEGQITICSCDPATLPACCQLADKGNGVSIKVGDCIGCDLEGECCKYKDSDVCTEHKRTVFWMTKCEEDCEDEELGECPE